MPPFTGGGGGGGGGGVASERCEWKTGVSERDPRKERGRRTDAERQWERRSAREEERSIERERENARKSAAYTSARRTSVKKINK